MLNEQHPGLITFSFKPYTRFRITVYESWELIILMFGCLEVTEANNLVTTMLADM